MAVTQERPAVKPKLRRSMPRSVVCSPRTPYDLNFLKYRFKAEPCKVAGCDQDPSRCPFLHPGEIGRRDYTIYFYDTKPCAEYCRSGGSCPRGDRCRHAHGFLERRFHPYRIWHEEALEFADLEEHLEEEERLSRHAPERAAIQFILDLKRRAGFYRYGQPEAIAPVATQLSLYDTCEANYQHYQGASIINELSGTFFYGSGLTSKRNCLSLCGVPFDEPQEDILNTAKGVTASTTSIQKRTRGKSTYVMGGLSLSRFFRAPKPGNVEDDFKAPFVLDSGASVHAVGESRMLKGYSSLPNPWQITLADGKSLNVIGQGTIEWGPFIIPNVRHVDGLDGIVISVNQLDRDHKLFSCFGGGICMVTREQADKNTIVVGKGTQTSTGVYALSSLHVLEPEAAREEQEPMASVRFVHDVDELIDV